MPYDSKTVPEFKIRAATLGDIDIVDEHSGFVLYNQGIQWMALNKFNHEEIKEFYSSYDIGYGDVLISGLGFGILALWLCEKESVKSVTVLEISKDVITLFKTANPMHKKLTIINQDASKFISDKKYDCLLLDHYEKQNFDWRLKNMKEISKNIKHEKFWAWSLEQIYLFKMMNIQAKDIMYKPNEDTIFKDIPDLSIFWKEFVDNYLPEEKSLYEFNQDQINEYIYLYFDKQKIYNKYLESKDK